ncbi:MAG: FHA domain-containing protein, partial [Gammaproteobacteria bacterium]|nr:FHA domain-containing protein [Gammaproteobacteria bacterium]
AQANKGANAAEELADLRKVADEQACEITALRAQTKEAEDAADELAGLRKIADEQELEIQSLREIVEADTGKDDANQLKIRIRDLEQDLGEADGRYQELEAEKSAALEQAEQMASQVSALNDELKASEDRQESARRESLALKEKLAVSEQVVRDMQDALRGRDEHADWLKTELNRLQGADEALAQSKNEKTEAEKQHRVLEEELHSAREELSQLRADLDKAASAHKELAEARQELEATRNRVSETDALAATLAEEKAVLTNTLSDREAALAHLDEQNRDIANQKESLEEMLEDITARLAERELALDNTRKAEQQLATENKDLISDLDALRDEMKQASAFKTQYEKQKELNAKLGATLDEQTEEIAELTTKLAEQAIAHSKANASLSGMNKLKPEIGELSSQIDDMHSQMLANHENTHEIEQQIEANDLKFTEAQEEIAALRALHVELRGELRTAEVQTGELDKAKQEILSLQDIVAELRNSQTESERSGDELSELQQQLADRDQQQEDLAQELSESRAQLNEIQKEFAREAEDNHELQRQLLALAEVEEQLREELLQRGDSYEDLAAIENERNQLREELESLRRIHDSVRQKQRAKAASRQTHIPEGRFAFDLQFRHGKSEFDTRRLVEEGDRLLIGRGQQSDVVVDSEFVSRNHLLISISRGRLFVKDLHSTNGTFVNGKRVSHYEMRDGDVIGIGEHSISLETVPL